MQHQFWFGPDDYEYAAYLEADAGNAEHPQGYTGSVLTISDRTERHTPLVIDDDHQHHGTAEAEVVQHDRIDLDADLCRILTDVAGQLGNLPQTGYAIGNPLEQPET